MPAQTVAAGATLLAIPGGFGTTPTQLTLIASWPTQCAQVTQTPNVTTVAFNIPCPPQGGRLYWTQPAAQSTIPPNQGSIAVPAGDIGATVFGAFTDGSQIALTLSWLTDWTITAADCGEFTAAFSNPAPPGGGTMYWTEIPLPEPIESGAFATLGDYVDEMRRLLHDPVDQYWSLSDKVADINRALHRRDLDTMGNRQLIPFVLTLGKDTYVFSDLGGFGPVPYAPVITLRSTGVPWFATPSLPIACAAFFQVDFNVPVPPGGAVLQWSVPLIGASGSVPPTTTAVTLADGVVSERVDRPAAPKIFDVVGLNLIYIAQRVVLLQFSFTKLNVFKRPWVPYQAIPEGWCRYGTSQVIIGPQPSLNYLTEWDCAMYSEPLVNLTDTDPVPFPYTIRLVPKYACYLAKMNERQYDEANLFLQSYMQEVDVSRNQRVGMLPSAYGKPNGY